MSSNITKALNQMLTAIRNEINVKLNNLKFNKTYMGVVQSFEGGVAKVIINENLYDASCDGDVLVGQVVRVISPNNNFNQLYVDGLKSTGGGDGSGGVDAAYVNRKVSEHNINTTSHDDIRKAIPTKNSQLENDCGYITKADIPEFPDIPEIPNLNDYYTKLETYNREEVNQFLTTKSDIVHTHNDLYYLKSEVYSKFEAYDKVEVDTRLNDKANFEHIHDDRYYTENETYNREEIDKKITDVVTGGGVDLGNYYTKLETDTKLSTKSDTTHDHDAIYPKKNEVFTKVETAALLETKAEKVHDHSDLYYTKDEAYAKTEVYNKLEVDNKIADAGQVDLSNYYTKSETYGKTSLYNKSEVDEKLITKVDLTDVFTKEEVAAQLSTKSNVGHNHDDKYLGKADVYLKAEVDTKLKGKSDTTHIHDDRYYQKKDVYTKLETDEKIGEIVGGNLPDMGEYYTKAQTYSKLESNSLLSNKADKSTTYTKLEVDSSLGNKAEKTHSHNDLYYGKAEVYTKLETYPKTNLYNKAEVDKKITDAVTGGQVDLSNYYTKQETYNREEVDKKIGASGTDLSNYYTKSETYNKTESDNLLKAKADKSTTYTKTEVNALIPVVDVNKAYVDLGLSGKSDTGHNHDASYPKKADVYAKIETYNRKEIDDKVAGNIPDLTGYYTKLETDTKLGDKSDKTHNHSDLYYGKGEVYTQAESDGLLSGKSNVGHNHDTSYYKKTDTYSKTQTNTYLADKSDKTHTHDASYYKKVDTYNKAEVNTELGKKSSIGHHHNASYYTKSQNYAKTETYNKAEIDSMVSGNVPDLSGYYTKVETDTKLSVYALSENVYDKVATDKKLVEKSNVGHTHNDAYYTKNEVYTKQDVYSKTETYNKTEIDSQISGGLKSSMSFEDFRDMKNMYIAVTFHANGNVTEEAKRSGDNVVFATKTTTTVSDVQINEVETFNPIATGGASKMITRQILFGAGTITETIS